MVWSEVFDVMFEKGQRSPASGRVLSCSSERVKTQRRRRKHLLRRKKKKKKPRSPLLLSLIKFSALITIKPLSMYNNVCITEQHRCSPSTQLNIKMAVAVLIAAWCAKSVTVCVCVCINQPRHCRGGIPLVAVLSLRDLQLHPSERRWAQCGCDLYSPCARCARRASLKRERKKEENTAPWIKNPHECMNIPALHNQRTVSLMQN